MALKKLEIPFEEMKGLMQAVDDNLLSLSYSPDCKNIDVSDGILSTIKGATKISNVHGYTPHLLFYIKRGPTNTYEIPIICYEDELENKYFYYLNNAWTELTHDAGSIDLTSHSVMYRVNDLDVLILATTIHNGGDEDKQLQKIYLNQNPLALHMETLSESAPVSDYITLHRDRLWTAEKGTNTIRYSNAYDPTDWTTAGKTGSIEIATFDGDYITGITTWLDDVIVFKHNSIWKIAGDIPSEYEVVQIYSSDGLKWEYGMCTDGNLCFFTGKDGIYRYDGTGVYPVLTSQIKDIYKNMVDIRLNIINNTLYIMTADNLESIPCIKYDIVNKRIMPFHTRIMDSSVVGNTLYVLDTDALYKLTDTDLKYGTFVIPAYWNTPETDLGYPHAEKTITDLYFNGWGTDNAGNAGGQVKITAYYKGMNGVQKTKEKIVTLSTTRKQHDVRLGITGRLFKFKFENVNGSAINLSGITLVCELAED